MSSKILYKQEPELVSQSYFFFRYGLCSWPYSYFGLARRYVIIVVILHYSLHCLYRIDLAYSGENAPEPPNDVDVNLPVPTEVILSGSRDSIHTVVHKHTPASSP